MTTATPPSSSRASGTESASHERIDDVDVTSEMESSFLEYAYSVIYSRALPDARDGLKPVQRRILYQMTEMGLRPDKGHVKSARVVGDVMGKLHPHGDASIYDAMVRLNQPFILRVPLIDGHGNFGSLDDGPAAPRYTEARLTPAALALTADLGEDVVDFVPNYDNQLTQPEVLPAAFPNLLVNGASGIAVGMATNMVPHNLIEVVAAAQHLLAYPRASLDDIMSFIPGPDLPTGGTIVGLSGVREAYETGRGSFKTRARVTIEPITARKAGIIVTELPYMVGAEKVIEKIKDGVTAKKLGGISDVTDLTDRTHGLRLVIGIKTGFNPQAVLEQLYKHTPLEDQFNINAVALVDGGPQTLGLIALLQVYLDHRIRVTTRRTTFRLARRQEQLHLVEGLLVAILNIDEVIAVIRGSDDTEQARTRLIEIFDLSEIQSQYILELRLRRLTKFSRIELEADRDRLSAEIAELTRLLADPQLIRTLVSDELGAVAEEFGTPRRTMLTEAVASPAPGRKAPPASLELSDVPCSVILSTTGRIVRVDTPDTADPLASPAARRSRHDAIRSIVRTTSRTEVGAVTSAGRLIRLSPIDLPVVPLAAIELSAGVSISDYVGPLDRNEHVVGLVSLTDPRPITLGTVQGVVKRVIAGDAAPKPQFDIIALKPHDEVVAVAHSDDSDDLVFVTSDARLLRFSAAQVRPQGRNAGGMAGVKVSPGAQVLFFGAISDIGSSGVVTISHADAVLPGIDPGRVKVSPLDEFPAKGRATSGVRSHALLKGESGLTLAWAGPLPAHAVAATGAARTLPDWLAKRDASGAPLSGEVHSLGGHLLL